MENSDDWRICSVRVKRWGVRPIQGKGPLEVAVLDYAPTPEEAAQVLSSRIGRTITPANVSIVEYELDKPVCRHDAQVGGVV